MPKRSKRQTSRRDSLPLGGMPTIDAAMKALRESEARMRAVLDTAVEGIITIDHRGRIESMNPAAERLFGYAENELLGKTVNTLMPSPYREEHDGYLKRYLKTGKARIIGIGREVVGLRKDGTEFPMDLSVSEVQLPDRRLFTGFVRDITERKRLEREILQISERERQRIGQDLHDGLGQHLAGIEMMSQVLHQRLATDRSAEAKSAGDIARHVRATITQARALARGLSPVVVQSEGLMAALRELAVSTRSLFGVSCDFVCRGDVLIRDPQEANHLFRIAQEAVSNAVKHGEARAIRITLSHGADSVRLRVIDDGHGLRNEPSLSRGMGFRIMQYRAGVLGGRFSLRSRPKRGAELLCTVPRR